MFQEKLKILHNFEGRIKILHNFEGKIKILHDFEGKLKSCIICKEGSCRNLRRRKGHKMRCKVFSRNPLKLKRMSAAANMIMSAYLYPK